MTMNIVKKSGDSFFPAVFGWDVFDRLFGEFQTHLFDEPQTYPTDVVEVKDDKGQVVAYEVDITLAGIPKENVKVVVEDDTVNISVDKVEATQDEKRKYLRKGIAQRSMRLRYGLHGIDKDKIDAKMVDGMLKVVLPVAEEAKPKSRNVEIG